MSGWNTQYLCLVFHAWRVEVDGSLASAALKSDRNVRLVVGFTGVPVFL